MQHPPAPLTPAQADDVVAVIEREAAAVAAAFGVAVPGEAAAALVDRLLLCLGGEKYYLPKPAALERSRLHAELRARFNGSNYAELARDSGLTTRRVQQIVNARVKRVQGAQS